jgi:hypothetical protein
MSQEKDKFWLIEDYLKGSLTEEEREAFEAKLEKENSLQAQVEIARLSQLALQRQKLWEVKNMAIAIDKEERQKTLAKKILGWSLGAVLIGACLIFWINLEKEAPIPVAPTKVILPLPSKPAKVEVAVPVPRAPATLPSPETKKGVENKKSQEVSSPTVKVTEAPLVPSVLPAQPETQPMAEKQAIKTVQVNQAIPASPVEKPKEAQKVENTCANVHIEAFTAIENACVDDHNGKILVSGLKGGKAPYEVKVLDEAKQRVPDMHLAAGKYAVTITDQQGCTKVLEGMQVKEEDCKKNYELNASNGDVLEMGTASTSCSLSIYDKAGNLYLYKLFGQGEVIKWDGNSTKGEGLAGYFIFTITYPDGKVKKGSITVMR